MYKYYDPEKVVSPRDCISEVTTIFDGGADYDKHEPFSLAVVTWDGEKRIGIRWNVTYREWEDQDKKSGVKMCVGEPNSRGYPTWFMLPVSFLAELLSGTSKVAEAVSKALKEIADEPADSRE